MVGVKTLADTTFKFVEPAENPSRRKNLTEFVTNNESQTETADIDAPIVFVATESKRRNTTGRLQNC